MADPVGDAPKQASGEAPAAPRPTASTPPERGSYPLSPAQPTAPRAATSATRTQPVVPRPATIANRPAPATGRPPSRPTAAARPSYRAEGFVCLLAMIVWAAAGQWLFQWVGTMSLMNMMGASMSLMFEPQRPADGPRGPGGIEPARGQQQATQLLPPNSPASVRQNRFQSPRTLDLDAPGQAASIPPPDPREAEAARMRRLEALNRAAGVAEATRLIWAVVTSILIGLMLAAALAALFRTTTARLPPFALISIALGACLAGLAVWRLARPVPDSETWLTWTVGITQSSFSWAGHLALALLIAVLASLFSLRPTSDPRRWLTWSAVIMLLGTMLTLAGIAVLQNQGGFPPLPNWTFCVVAFCQSIFAFLMLMLLRLRHPAPAV